MGRKLETSKIGVKKLEKFDNQYSCTGGNEEGVRQLSKRFFNLIFETERSKPMMSLPNV